MVAVYHPPTVFTPEEVSALEPKVPLMQGPRVSNYEFARFPYPLRQKLAISSPSVTSMNPIGDSRWALWVKLSQFLASSGTALIQRASRLQALPSESTGQLVASIPPAPRCP